jgi:excisionase family DNA binding protein
MPAEALHNNAQLAYSELEAAKLLGISGRTLFSLRAAGKIAFIKLAAGKQARVLYPRVALEKFIAENTQIGGAA